MSERRGDGQPSPSEVAASELAAPSAQPVDTTLAAFVLLLKFLRVPVDPEQIVHDRGRGPDGFTHADLLRVAKRIGVKARGVEAPPARLANLPLPAIAACRDGTSVIFLRADEDESGLRVLVQHPHAATPIVWDAEALEANYAGRLLLLTTRERLAGGMRRFDISWFIPALVKYRKPLRDVLVASFFLQVMALIAPIFFQLVIDKVLVHHSLTTLDVLAIGLSVVTIWEVGLSGLRNWLFAHTTNRVDAELSASLFRHLLNLPLSYFETRRVGDSVARVRELETIREFLTSNSVTLVLDLLFTIVFLAVMHVYSPLLTLVVVLSIPVYVAISVVVTPPLRARLDEKFKRGAENQAFLVETVSGVGTLKSMAVEPQMRERWERQFAGYTQTGFSVARLANWGSHAVQLVSKLTTVAILYFGAKAVIEGDLTVGALVAFNMLAGRVAAPILRLSQLWQDFQQIRISVDRLGDVLNAEAEPEHNPNRASLPPIKGRIEFDKVRFRYRTDAAEVLRGVTLTVAPGEMLGIVGPSGSGKSTLTKLIQRLYVPGQGRVLVDGVDLALVDPAWLRRQIGVVLQENILFNRTVRENIALSDPTRPMQAVMAAAQLAGAHEFILALPHGYDTVIDERGSNLSGGQRQRIAIARALITNPRILIFDEATSALDAESEEIVQKNLKLIAHGRTVIIIAHRLSAVRQCNRIITVDSGEITEEGDHEALLRAGGRYADLYRRQMGVSA